jgi:hypothetical protein
LVLGLMLIKELSGEKAIQRTGAPPDKAYLQVAQKRFDGINRCC